MFAGTNAWITGASSGIGRSLALALAGQGARLVLSGRNVAALDEVAAQCGEALVLPFETTDLAALPGLAQRAWDWSGGIDMLVNNAGISQRSLALETDLAVYRKIVDVDLIAPIALTQQLLGRMAERGSGRIVMISSLAGKFGVPMRSAYCAAKFGLIGYADSIRAETAHLGIKVHVVAPGSIRTGVARNALQADGSVRGTSDVGIENGIDPDVAAADMLAAIAADEREIIIAEGAERALGLTRRTPDEVFDRIGGWMAQGYAERLKAGVE